MRTAHAACSFAFQPIVDVHARRVFAYEALIRGLKQEPPSWVFKQWPVSEHDELDQHGREVAVTLAAKYRLETRLSLNVQPQSVRESDAALRRTLEHAERCGLSPAQVILEITEGQMIEDAVRFADAVNGVRAAGVAIAIDDFGAGYSGLNLLADFQPDLIKLDINLVRNIETRGPRQAIVRAILSVCDDLGIDVIAEGLETVDEYHWFQDVGVRLFQGFLFGRPAFEALSTPHFPD